MAQKVLGTHTVLPGLKQTEKEKYFVDFLHPCVRNRTLKTELEHKVYCLLYIQPFGIVFVLKQVIEDCRC